MSLTLGRNGTLMYRRRQDEPAKDVARAAAEFLFEPVVLEDQVRLADLFALLGGCRALQRIFRRDFAVEFCEEAAKWDPASAKPLPDYDPDGIEWVEVYQTWSLNSAEKVYDDVGRWQFHGIGYLLRESRDGWAAGSRVRWGLDFTLLADLLPLPLKVNAEVPVCESDIDSVNYGQELQTVRNECITLGQLIHAVLWELSFYGAPGDKQAWAEETKALADAVRSGEVETEPLDLDTMFGGGHEKAMAAMFTETCGKDPKEVREIMHAISDDASAWGVFSLHGIEIGVPYRSLTGREFRKAYRKVRYGD